MLSPSQQQELRAIGKAFDPLRLFQQVEQLQQATFRCEAWRAPASQPTPAPSLVLFDLAGCAAERVFPLPRYPKSESGLIVRRPPSVSSHAAPDPSSREKGQHLTMERAIQGYLQAHRTVGHRPKTLEWHQFVLGHVCQYLLTECHVLLIHQITETTMRSWLVSLAQTPTTRGSLRSASTIETYARSARAFFGWLVERGTLSCSPMSEGAFPWTRVPLPHVVSPAFFEQVMQAGFSPHVNVPGATRLAARDQALLWVLFDTGITVSELCALRVADLDRKTGLLRVRGKGGNERQLSLGSPCLSHLRGYLRQMDPTTRRGLARKQAGGDPLFGSQGKQSLTRNGVTMVFARFRKRAGISETTITPQVLRHSVALRYLQIGGNPQGLQQLLGYEGMAPVRQYLRWYDQLLHEQTQQETEAVPKALLKAQRSWESSQVEREALKGETPGVRSFRLWEKASSLVSQAPGRGMDGNGLDLGRQVYLSVPHGDRPRVMHWATRSVWSKTTNALETVLHSQRKTGEKRG